MFATDSVSVPMHTPPPQPTEIARARSLNPLDCVLCTCAALGDAIFVAEVWAGTRDFVWQNNLDLGAIGLNG